MNTADPANPWSRLLTTPPTTTVESILRYPAHSHDYRRHLADYEATRIEPGADPRAGWARQAHQHPLIDRDLLDSDYDGLALFERGPKTSPRPTSVVFQLRRRDFRYVPHDVIRWRDPEHRAALGQRARAYAALQPEAKR